jgi:hypothetical protein
MLFIHKTREVTRENAEKLTLAGQRGILKGSPNFPWPDADAAAAIRPSNYTIHIKSSSYNKSFRIPASKTGFRPKTSPF